MNPIEKALVDADEYLTKDNWIKGNYFAIFGDEIVGTKLCMCPHGAVQAQVNPKVQEAVAEFFNPLLADMAYSEIVESVRTQCASVAYDALKFPSWNKRPSAGSLDSKYGSYDAHFILGMVGLTTLFNDADSTTFQMVKDKFQEAIKLAQKLGV